MPFSFMLHVKGLLLTVRTHAAQVRLGSVHTYGELGRRAREGGKGGGGGGSLRQVRGGREEEGMCCIVE